MKQFAPLYFFTMNCFFKDKCTSTDPKKLLLFAHCHAESHFSISFDLWHCTPKLSCPIQLIDYRKLGHYDREDNFQWRLNWLMYKVEEWRPALRVGYLCLVRFYRTVYHLTGHENDINLRIQRVCLPQNGMSLCPVTY